MGKGWPGFIYGGGINAWSGAVLPSRAQRQNYWEFDYMAGQSYFVPRYASNDAYHIKLRKTFNKDI